MFVIRQTSFCIIENKIIKRAIKMRKYFLLLAYLLATGISLHSSHFALFHQNPYVLFPLSLNNNHTLV